MLLGNYCGQALVGALSLSPILRRDALPYLKLINWAESPIHVPVSFGMYLKNARLAFALPPLASLLMAPLLETPGGANFYSAPGEGIGSHCACLRGRAQRSCPGRP